VTPVTEEKNVWHVTRCGRAESALEGLDTEQLVRGAWRTLVGFLCGAVLCLSWLCVQTYAFARAYSGRILPGTVISGVDIGGMTAQQALEAVRATVEPQLDRTITLMHSDHTWLTTPRELGATSDAAPALVDALNRSEEATWKDWFRMRWLGKNLSVQRNVVMAHDEQAVRALADQIAAEVAVPVRDASFSYSSRSVELQPEQVGRAAAPQAISKDLLAALSNGHEVVQVQSLEIQPDATIVTWDKVLLLRQDEHRLYLYQHGQRTHDWLVSTGTGGFPTPTGQFEIAEKRYLPTWVNPDPTGWGKGMPAVIGPGPDNPLGVRALNWSGTNGIRFHGTSNIASLGQNASHGCVRLSNEDIIALYDLVDVGTKVISLR
jgi:lipoprotein-anchoring transpeptidase ErfK/SrfK